MKIKPLHDRVVVKTIPSETKTISGIIIPETAQEKPQRGKVVAVGNGKKDEPLTVKIDDIVLFDRYSGHSITIDEEELLILRESEIWGIIN